MTNQTLWGQADTNVVCNIIQIMAVLLKTEFLFTLIIRFTMHIELGHLSGRHIGLASFAALVMNANHIDMIAYIARNACCHSRPGEVRP